MLGACVRRGPLRSYPLGPTVSCGWPRQPLAGTSAAEASATPANYGKAANVATRLTIDKSLRHVASVQLGEVVRDGLEPGQSLVFGVPMVSIGEPYR